MCFHHRPGKAIGDSSKLSHHLTVSDIVTCSLDCIESLSNQIRVFLSTVLILSNSIVLVIVAVVVDATIIAPAAVLTISVVVVSIAVIVQLVITSTATIVVAAVVIVAWSVATVSVIVCVIAVRATARAATTCRSPSFPTIVLTSSEFDLTRLANDTRELRTVESR
eukprot:2589989-Rhodomonas_salina.1